MEEWMGKGVSNSHLHGCLFPVEEDHRNLHGSETDAFGWWQWIVVRYFFFCGVIVYSIGAYVSNISFWRISHPYAVICFCFMKRVRCTLWHRICRYRESEMKNNKRQNEYLYYFLRGRAQANKWHEPVTNDSNIEECDPRRGSQNGGEIERQPPRNPHSCPLLILSACTVHKTFELFYFCSTFLTYLLLNKYANVRCAMCVCSLFTEFFFFLHLAVLWCECFRVDMSHIHTSKEKDEDEERSPHATDDCDWEGRLGWRVPFTATTPNDRADNEYFFALLYISFVVRRSPLFLHILLLLFVSSWIAFWCDEHWDKRELDFNGLIYGIRGLLLVIAWISWRIYYEIFY